MPRTAPNPSIGVLRFFEDAPLAEATLTLDLAKETLRRRQAGKSVLTADGPKVDPPQAKRSKRSKPASQPVASTEALAGTDV